MCAYTMGANQDSPKGFEPLASAFAGLRSFRLSFGELIRSEGFEPSLIRVRSAVVYPVDLGASASGWNRTNDACLFRAALYQTELPKQVADRWVSSPIKEPVIQRCRVKPKPSAATAFA